MKPNILVVDDDLDLARTRSQSFLKRGFNATIAHSAEHAILQAGRTQPAFAVVDLRLEGPSGIECVKALKSILPNLKVVVLTDYASITTAVEAIRAGAHAFVNKPASADDVLRAFESLDADRPLPKPERQMSLRDLEWERINRALLENNFNISVTARALSMPRRNPQKKLELAGHPPQPAEA